MNTKHWIISRIDDNIIITLNNISKIIKLKEWEAVNFDLTKSDRFIKLNNLYY